jgi:GLPGLI family protein
MKKFILIHFLFFSFSVLSQKNSFFGKVEYEQINKKSSKTHSIATLIFNDTLSLYSWNNSNKNQETAEKTEGSETVYNLSSTKENSYFLYNQKENNIVSRFFLDGKPNFIKEDTLRHEWELIDEFKKINSYNCQKAKTIYKGKIFFAFFTTDIPIPYGPNKFNGLSGLILELFDEEKNIYYFVNEITINNKLIKDFVVTEIVSLNFEDVKFMSPKEYDVKIKKSITELEGRLNSRREKDSKLIKFNEDCEDCNK